MNRPMMGRKIAMSLSRITGISFFLISLRFKVVRAMEAVPTGFEFLSAVRAGKRVPHLLLYGLRMSIPT